LETVDDICAATDLTAWDSQKIGGQEPLEVRHFGGCNRLEDLRKITPDLPERGVERFAVEQVDYEFDKQHTRQLAADVPVGEAAGGSRNVNSLSLVDTCKIER